MREKNKKKSTFKSEISRQEEKEHHATNPVFEITP